LLTKCFVTGIAVVALAVGAGASNATLSSSTSASVKISRAGRPASITLRLTNVDDAVVPEPITAITLSSKYAKWNSKAVSQCRDNFPDERFGTYGYFDEPPFCPAASKIGTGTFSLNTGVPGQQIPAVLGYLDGDVNIYNHSHSSAEQAELVFELMSDVPVPNAHTYVTATVNKRGELVIPVLVIAQLPVSVRNILSPPGAPRLASLTGLNFTIKSPKRNDRRAPFLTFPNLKKAKFAVALQRGG
jgi:hypothetical protein